MTPAAAALAAGFSALLATHGESLGYVPASAVVKSENGEVITTESGIAVLSDDTETAITGIIDDEYQMASAAGMEFVSTAPAAILRASEVTGIQRNALIIRKSDEQVFYVQAVQAALKDGTQLVILSKQAH